MIFVLLYFCLLTRKIVNDNPKIDYFMDENATTKIPLVSFSIEF